MSSFRRALFAILYAVTSWVRSRKRPAPDARAASRIDHRTQTRGMRLLGQNRFIDRMRRRWLRVRASDD
ncbi:MAG: hypothetical protein KDA32_03100 [Phycisphaerales bacterium]|nr:hypothetical protein [Phycisphaerales bacterium]